MRRCSVGHCPIKNGGIAVGVFVGDKVRRLIVSTRDMSCP